MVLLTVVLGVVMALGLFALFWSVLWWATTGEWQDLGPARWWRHRRLAREAVAGVDAEYARLLRDWRGGTRRD